MHTMRNHMNVGHSQPVSVFTEPIPHAVIIITITIHHSLNLAAAAAVQLHPQLRPLLTSPKALHSLNLLPQT